MQDSLLDRPHCAVHYTLESSITAGSCEAADNVSQHAVTNKLKHLQLRMTAGNQLYVKNGTCN